MHTCERMTQCGEGFHQRAGLDVAVADDAFAVAPAAASRASGEAARSEPGACAEEGEDNRTSRKGDR